VIRNRARVSTIDFSLCKEEIVSALAIVGVHVSFEEFLNITDNDRFGGNLLGKFGDFDTVAKKAVNALLAIDEHADRSLDRRSVEYRKKAQEQLLDFERNREILKRLEEEGVDTEAWLSYDVVSYFELGAAEDLSFGEKISHPVKRLPEAMKAYTASIKNALTTYKKELENATFKEDISDLYTQMQSIELRILQETDEKKKEGMRKGLLSLQERTQNPKQMRVWDKLHTEIAKLYALAEGVVTENNSLIELEKNKIVVVDEESSKKAILQKELIWKKQKSLVSDTTKLHRRVHDIFDVYEKTLSSVIGEERASGMVSQIQNEVREHADHMRADFDTIFAFTGEHFNEGESHVGEAEVEDDEEYTANGKDTKSLEGRPMSIRVGGRSRQDLYLGNYTTCCIRIDSDYHQAESPIADYITDLGMQNVIIYDEITKTPIACAWCWIGDEYDIPDGKIALVVDNVEGWQKYTVNFKKQLEEKLREYLKEYAKAIHIENLSQGSHYNDLDVIDELSQEERFTKIGGNNRGTGYYLEAENDPDGGGVEDDYNEFGEDN
jgi:hypothetical protein